MNFMGQLGIVGIILFFALVLPLVIGYGHLFRREGED